MSTDSKTSKNSSLAFVLGLPFCGIGHVVCGRWAKGIFLFVIFCVSIGLGALVFFGPLSVVFPPFAALLFWAFAFCLWVYSLADLWEIKTEPLPVLDRDHVPTAGHEDGVVPALAPKPVVKEKPKAPTVAQSKQFEEEKKWFHKEEPAVKPEAESGPEPVLPVVAESEREKKEETVYLSSEEHKEEKPESGTDTKPEQDWEEKDADNTPEPATKILPSEDKKFIPLSEHSSSDAAEQKTSSRAEKSSAFSYRKDEESVSPFPSMAETDRQEDIKEDIPEEQETVLSQPTALSQLALESSKDEEEKIEEILEQEVPAQEEKEEPATIVDEKEPEQETSESGTEIKEEQEEEAESEELDPAQLAELVVEEPIPAYLPTEDEPEEEVQENTEEKTPEQTPAEEKEEPDSDILEQEKVREFTSAVLEDLETPAEENSVAEAKEEESADNEPEELDPAQLAELVVEEPTPAYLPTEDEPEEEVQENTEEKTPEQTPAEENSVQEVKEKQKDAEENKAESSVVEETAPQPEEAVIANPEVKEESVSPVVEEKQEPVPVVQEEQKEASSTEPETISEPDKTEEQQIVSEEVKEEPAEEKIEDKVPEEENPADQMSVLAQKINESESDGSRERSGADPEVYEYARTLQLKGLLGPAAAEYEKILCFNPYDADCLFQLGKIEFARGRKEEALDYLTRCQQADSGGVWSQEILFLLEEHKDSDS